MERAVFEVVAQTDRTAQNATIQLSIANQGNMIIQNIRGASVEIGVELHRQ